MKIAKVVLCVFAAALTVLTVIAAVREKKTEAGAVFSVSVGVPRESCVDAQSGKPPLPSTPQPPDSEASPQTAVLSDRMVAWGIGSAVNELNQPTDAVAAQERYAQLQAYFLCDDSEKNITLSFDLGYENGYTERILDALAECGVKGVFFITLDYARQSPEIVRRIIDEGHLLANHTAKHKCLPQISEGEAYEDVMSLHEYIKETFGYTMTWFRFPKGEFSEKTLKMLADNGYKSMFWSFAYVDWLTDNQPQPSAALEKPLNAAHPGAIYLLHAVSSTNAAIMGEFVTQMLSDGYVFVLPDTPSQQEGDFYGP